MSSFRKLGRVSYVISKIEEDESRRDTRSLYAVGAAFTVSLRISVNLEMMGLKEAEEVENT